MDYLKTREQLAQEYGISRYTIHRRLKESVIYLQRGMLDPNQLIIQRMGNVLYLEILLKHNEKEPWALALGPQV